MSVRQLWEGCDAAVWAQKLDGRTKLLILFLVAVLAIVVDNPRTLFLLFTAALLLHLTARTSVYKWQVLAVLLLLGLWGSMFSQALFFAQTPRTPLFVLIEPTMPVFGQITGGLYDLSRRRYLWRCAGAAVGHNADAGLVCLLDVGPKTAFKGTDCLAPFTADCFYACNGHTVFTGLGGRSRRSYCSTAPAVGYQGWS